MDEQRMTSCLSRSSYTLVIICTKIDEEPQTCNGTFLVCVCTVVTRSRADFVYIHCREVPPEGEMGCVCTSRMPPEGDFVYIHREGWWTRSKTPLDLVQVTRDSLKNGTLERVTGRFSAMSNALLRD